MVAELVNRFGWPATTFIVAAAGVVQIGYGLSRLGRFAQAIPPSVMHSMLAGIGGTIALAQLHVVLGGSPRSSVLANLRDLPAQVLDPHGPAVTVGVFTIAVVVGWPRFAGRLKAIPGPLLAVGLATALSFVALIDPATVPRGDLPGGLIDAIALPVLPQGSWGGVAGGVLTVALIASVESLLSAVAVDRMHHGPRTKVDRDLIGQGAGNTLSGLLGGLPVTGVIVRRSTNVRAEAKTRASAILHAVWVAVFALALVQVVEMVPLAALLVLRRAVRARVRHEAPPTDTDDEHRVTVEGAATFLCVPTLDRALTGIPAGAHARVDLNTHYLDHAARDHLHAWVRRHRGTSGRVTITDRRSAPGPRRLRVGSLHREVEQPHSSVRRPDGPPTEPLLREPRTSPESSPHPGPRPGPPSSPGPRPGAEPDRRRARR